jgi:hypothetical protein
MVKLLPILSLYHDFSELRVHLMKRPENPAFYKAG